MYDTDLNICNTFWMPPSLRELTPIIFNTELTHLGSEASIYNLSIQIMNKEKTTKIIDFVVMLNKQIHINNIFLYLNSMSTAVNIILKPLNNTILTVVIL